MACSHERPEPPTGIGGLGVDQAHGGQPRIVGHGVTSQSPAAVLAYEGDPVEFEQINHLRNVAGLLLNRERGRRIEAAQTGRRQIDHVARDMVGQVGEQLPPGGTAEGPTMNEQHVGTGTHLAIGSLAGADLIGEVIVAMGLRLQAVLTPAFAAPMPDHREMVRVGWPVLATAEHDRTFSLFFEANGLAAVGREPYAALVPAIVAMWIDWAAEVIDAEAVPDPADRRSEAEAAIAILDGLYLLRLLAGPEAAERAAISMGVG